MSLGCVQGRMGELDRQRLRLDEARRKYFKATQKHIKVRTSPLPQTSYHKHLLVLLPYTHLLMSVVHLMHIMEM